MAYYAHSVVLGTTFGTDYTAFSAFSADRSNTITPASTAGFDKFSNVAFLIWPTASDIKQRMLYARVLSNSNAPALTRTHARFASH